MANLPKELVDMLDGLGRTRLKMLRDEVTHRLYQHDSVNGVDMWGTVRDCLVAHGVSCGELVPIRYRKWVSNACAGLAEFESNMHDIDSDFRLTRIERTALIRMVADEYIKGKLAGEDGEYIHPNAGQILQQFNNHKRIGALIDRMFPGYGCSIIKGVLRNKRGPDLIDGIKP